MRMEELPVIPEMVAGVGERAELGLQLALGESSCAAAGETLGLSTALGEATALGAMLMLALSEADAEADSDTGLPLVWEGDDDRVSDGVKLEVADGDVVTEGVGVGESDAL